MTLRRYAVAASFAFLAAVYLFATYRDLGRGPAIDEVEHLHTAVRMARGDRIYTDFAQHHPPLFHGLLIPLVHDGNTIEAMRGYVTRARWLVAVITAAAVIAVGLLVFRATGNAAATVIFAGVVFAAGGVWRNGLGDIRPDALAIMLWWVGAALALLPGPAARRGIGIGLVFVAALVIPKWPLMSLVVGIAFVIDIGRNPRALAKAAFAALVTAAAGLGATALLADLRPAYFHVIEFTQWMLGPLGPSSEHRPATFFACPLLLRPVPIGLAALLIVAAWLRARHAFASPRLVAVLFAIAAASLCEIRFLYRYPVVEHRYYANWVLAASAILALAIHSAAALLTATGESLRKLATAITTAAVVLALLASLDIVAPQRPQPDLYWRWTAWMLGRMRPGDTVWLDRPLHPIGIPDATYHWLGIGDVIPLAIRLKDTPEGRRFLPAIGDADLPPCRVERGLDRHLRFLSEPAEAIPESRACFERLITRGVIKRTPLPDVFEVIRS